MLGSNQRSPPCKGSTTISPSFASVQNNLQNAVFWLSRFRGRSLLFVWVAARLLHLCRTYMGIVAFFSFSPFPRLVPKARNVG